MDRGQFAEAGTLLEEAVAARRKGLPAGAWQIAEAESALGACYAGLRRYPEAEPLLRSSYQTLRSLRGAGARETRRAASRLAEFDRRAGKSFQ